MSCSVLAVVLGCTLEGGEASDEALSFVLQSLQRKHPGAGGGFNPGQMQKWREGRQEAEAMSKQSHKTERK